jgi:calcineurin-like phosphoesterase family protein
MAVFFTSDTHFGHAGTLGLFRRPFASVRAMDDALVARWNETVGADDEVWHLGDFALGPGLQRAAALLGALAGRKHLVAGNNDPPIVRDLADWASVSDYSELTIDGRALVLCHYPFRSWKGMAEGALNLHGHSHGRLTPLPRQIDVGVDSWEFAPASLARLLAASRRRRPRQSNEPPDKSKRGHAMRGSP